MQRNCTRIDICVSSNLYVHTLHCSLRQLYLLGVLTGSFGSANGSANDCPSVGSAAAVCAGKLHRLMPAPAVAVHMASALLLLLLLLLLPLLLPLLLLLLV
jgi:hypothetical protein